ncbi:MAG: radical SAM protein [Acidobacteriota bacterium]
MRKIEIFRAWGRILTGYRPVLSIEITRECPLRCPGCYAYEVEHLGQIGPLRTLADFKGPLLVDKVLELVYQYRPVHLSIVGGEPLVRVRELDILLPRLSEMGIAVQLVTSAVRPIPLSWAKIKELYLVVSIDGLPQEHDRRRAPATYQRILQHIEGHAITVHCTITSQMTTRSGYFEEFLAFWTAKPEVKKVWFSLFTPQVGDQSEENLSPQQRVAVLTELAELRAKFPKLALPKQVIDGYLNPPQSPQECIFARSTINITADLKSRITPCQFGGNPDCRQCGCMASAGLKAIGEYRILGVWPVKTLYQISERIGKMATRHYHAE